MASQLVSVVIPTKNAGAEFRQTLTMIQMQKTDCPVEILIVDSGSTDATLEICQEFNVRLIKINPSEFGHGKTRNLAISKSNGEFIVLTVQDGVPANEFWLDSMVKNLQVDPLVAGVYSRQLPRKDANSFTREALENHVTNRTNRVEQFVAKDAIFDHLLPMDKLRLITFDNVSSCIRRAVWKKTPFAHINFGEDIEWSKRVIVQGLKIVYEPDSAIIHSHNRSAYYELKRAYIAHKLLKQLVGLHLVPGLGNVFRNSYAEIGRRFSMLRHNEKNNSLLYVDVIMRVISLQVGMYLGGNEELFMKYAIFRSLDRQLTKGV